MDTALPSAAFVPSDRIAFGLPGHIRLSYAADSTVPEEAGRRITDMCANLSKG